jgi:hypothetical protein
MQSALDTPDKIKTAVSQARPHAGLSISARGIDHLVYTNLGVTRFILVIYALKER